MDGSYFCFLNQSSISETKIGSSLPSPTSSVPCKLSKASLLQDVGQVT